MRKAMKWLEAHSVAYNFHDYKKQGIETGFEMNPGGHFDDYADRLAKGIAYLLNGGKQIQ